MTKQKKILLKSLLREYKQLLNEGYSFNIINANKDFVTINIMTEQYKDNLINALKAQKIKVKTSGTKTIDIDLDDLIKNYLYWIHF